MSSSKDSMSKLSPDSNDVHAENTGAQYVNFPSIIECPAIKPVIMHDYNDAINSEYLSRQLTTKQIVVHKCDDDNAEDLVRSADRRESTNSQGDVKNCVITVPNVGTTALNFVASTNDKIVRPNELPLPTAAKTSKGDKSSPLRDIIGNFSKRKGFSPLQECSPAIEIPERRKGGAHAEERPKSRFDKFRRQISRQLTKVTSLGLGNSGSHDGFNRSSIIMRIRRSIWDDVRDSKIEDSCGRKLAKFLCNRATHHVFKRIMAVFSLGLVLSFLVATSLYFSQRIYKKVEVPPVWVIVGSGTLCLLLSLGLALKPSVRCVTALMLPSLCTTKGRAVLITIILQLLIAGPILNLTKNAQKLPEFSKCQLSLLSNQTKDMQEYASKKFSETSADYEKAVKAVVNTTMSTFEDTFSFIQNFFKNDKFSLTIPRDKINITVFGIVFRDQDLKYKNTPTLDKLYSTPNVDGSESLENATKNVQNEIESKFAAFRKFVSIASHVLPWSVILLFLQSYLYYRGYTTRLDYDNAFITSRFKRLDIKRVHKGKNAILPLRRREKSAYIDSTSILLSQREMHELFWGVVIVLVLFIFVSFVIFVDWFWYTLLDFANKHTNTTLTFTGGARFIPQLNTSLVSPSFRQLLLQQFPDFFNKTVGAYYNSSTDTNICSPTLLQPLYFDNKWMASIVGLYVAIFITTVLQAYGLRLQHRVAGYFFPEQDQRRVIHLYQSIKAKRLSLIRLLFHSHRESQDDIDGVSFQLWCSVRCPTLSRALKCFGIWTDTVCDLCGQQVKSVQTINQYECCDSCCEKHDRRSRDDVENTVHSSDTSGTRSVSG